MPGVRWVLMVLGLGLMANVATAQGATDPPAPAEAKKPVKKSKRIKDPGTTAPAASEPVKAKPASAASPGGPSAVADAKHPKQPSPSEGAHGSGAPPKAAATQPTAAGRAPAPNPAPAGPPTAAGTKTASVTTPGPTKLPQAPAVAAKTAGPTCKVEEPEQPRGGRLDVTGTNFGQAPVVRIAGKPARMLERREDLLSVQVPADSNGGPVSVQAQGKTEPCGALVIIGKNR